MKFIKTITYTVDINEELEQTFREIWEDRGVAPTFKEFVVNWLNGMYHHYNPTKEEHCELITTEEEDS